MLESRNVSPVLMAMLLALMTAALILGCKDSGYFANQPAFQIKRESGESDFKEYAQALDQFPMEKLRAKPVYNYICTPITSGYSDPDADGEVSCDLTMVTSTGAEISILVKEREADFKIWYHEVVPLYGKYQLPYWKPILAVMERPTRNTDFYRISEVKILGRVRFVRDKKLELVDREYEIYQ